MIDHDESGLVVLDRRSRNHTFLNRKQIQRAPFAEGDVLRIGGVQVRLFARSKTPTLSESPNVDTIFFAPRVEKLESFPSHEPERASLDWRQLLCLILDEAYDRLFELVAEIVPYERCFLILVDGEHPDGFQLTARLVRIGTPNEENVIISKTLLRRVVESRESVVLTREGEGNLSESMVLTQAQCALCVPISGRDQVLGVLYLDSRSCVDRFNERHVDLLSPLTSVIALKLENARLQDAQVAARLERQQLEVAESVQRSFEPGALPRLRGYSVEAYSSPFGYVGGDFYDVYAQSDSDSACCIGDVSGKGVSAALYSVSALSALRAHFEHTDSVRELVQQLQSHIRTVFRPTFFLTFFMAHLDLRTGRVAYCNAGHPPPVIVRHDGEIDELPVLDPALNMLPQHTYRWENAELKPGDLLVAFTDGILEQEGPEGELFGRERLVAYLREHRQESLTEIRDRLLRAIDAFAEPGERSDDLTLLFCRRENADT